MSTLKKVIIAGRLWRNMEEEEKDYIEEARRLNQCMSTMQKIAMIGDAHTPSTIDITTMYI